MLINTPPGRRCPRRDQVDRPEWGASQPGQRRRLLHPSPTTRRAPSPTRGQPTRVKNACSRIIPLARTQPRLCRATLHLGPVHARRSRRDSRRTASR
ncbi:hypothetical protein ACPA9J_00420 [Pseudomonas aeruginosa]